MPDRPRHALRAAASALCAALLVGGLGGCGGSPTDKAATPTTDDALRIAQAATDPILGLAAPNLRFGTVTQRPYICAEGDTCQPREGLVSRPITPNNVSNQQIMSFYLKNIRTKGWLVVDLFCDGTTGQYVLVGAKRDGNKSYPGRLEISAREQAEIKIVTPAFGAESQFSSKVDPAGFPRGTCDAELTALAEAARESLGPTTDGFATRGSTSSTTTTAQK